jgi:hypothetical protein
MPGETPGDIAMASAFKLRRSSRDEGQSDRDERVRTENIKAGRGNSTAERKSKSNFKAATPKGAAREEMSGKSDAPAKKKSKPKSASPFKLPSSAPVPTPRPDPSMYNVPQTPSWAGTETAPPPQFPPDLAASPPRPDNFQQPPGAFRPPMEGPPAINPAMLQSVPPELRAPLGSSMAGMETAPRPPLPNPLAQLGGSATSPFTGGPTGPGPGVDQRGMIARLLGLGG